MATCYEEKIQQAGYSRMKWTGIHNVVAAKFAVLGKFGVFEWAPDALTYKVPLTSLSFPPIFLI